jgi:hypothetical protein
MEDRCIKVSFETAKKWYNGDIPALKELALTVYTATELSVKGIHEMINEILNNKDAFFLTDTQEVQLRALHNRKDNNISAPKMLRIIALYYNRTWRKTTENTGYFLECRKVKDGYDWVERWNIRYHQSVNYPCIAYFRTETDARKAIEYLKMLGKLDALYTDL